jgi:hypothetical protein
VIFAELVPRKAIVVLERIVLVMSFFFEQSEAMS